MEFGLSWHSSKGYSRRVSALIFIVSLYNMTRILFHVHLLFSLSRCLWYVTR
jgi:hypothetical protein